MEKIVETREEHGKIDLNHLLKPIIARIREAPESLARERKGKIFVVTDNIIREIIEDKNLVKKISQEGKLFSKTDYAGAIATLAKNNKVLETQKKQITEMEDIIYEHLRSMVQEKGVAFSQHATSYFNGFGKLTNGKNADIDSWKSSIFSDAKLLKKYPGAKAMLRVPHHTIKMSGKIAESLVDNLKHAIKIRLSKELPEDEIDEILETVDKELNDNIGLLNDLFNVLDKNAYGRIRRTYACCVLCRMAQHLPQSSPFFHYARRMDEFNELVQGTLPDSGLAASDLILDFPNPDGKGTFTFDLMTEFANADALDKLPFWITFDELLSEITTTESVTTTMGQHFKLNGKVQARGGKSVFEFNVGKLEEAATALKAAKARAQAGAGEPDINIANLNWILKIAVLYYLVFNDDKHQSRDAVTNYKELRTHLSKLVAEKIPLEQILERIAIRLKDKTILDKNKQIRKDLKNLLKSRKLDNLSLNKEKLRFVISREILSSTEDMERGIPIKPPPAPYHTSYLQFLKITRHQEHDYNALIKEDIHITELFRYLSIPEADQCQRKMKRDINRNLIGVLFTPRNNNMLRLAVPFGDLARLIISYDRDLLHGIISGTDKKDDYLAGLAQLIHILLIYAVFKAIARMNGNANSHVEKNMLMMLSLFATSGSQLSGWEETERGFTHDAHKAVEHIIRQHIPTKSQGFKLMQSKHWEKESLAEHLKKEPSRMNAMAAAYVKNELSSYRYWNILTGLSSGLDSLWQLSEEPVIKKVALISVTSRACDRLRKRSIGDRDVMYGDIHRFEYESKDNGKNGISHFYRCKPIQAFCDEMDSVNRFNNPAILFHTIRKLYNEGFQDVMIVTKVPFTRRIRMTTYDDSTYTNTELLQALNKEMPELRVYPLFTQKSYGIRLIQGKSKFPIFIPHDPENDVTINASAQSTLFRVASVVTYRVVEGGGSGEKLHSGITDYLFRCYPETMTIQSKAISAITTLDKMQEALYEILRFLHANAYQRSISKDAGLEAKLDALETIIGDESVGQQANIIKFPNYKSGDTKKGNYKFSVNIIALLRHLENQSDLQRKKETSHS